jgi:hypothetical protein
MIMTLSILSVIVLGIGALYLSQIKLTQTDLKVAQSYNQLSLAMLSLPPLVSSADEVLPSATTDTGTYTTSLTTLVVSTPSRNTSGNSIENTFDIIVIRKENNTLVMETLANAASVRSNGTRTIASDIDNVLFTYQNSTSITQSSWVTCKISKTLPIAKSFKEVKLEHTIQLKNKN